MNRRRFLAATATLPLLAPLPSAAAPIARVRPGQPGWPDDAGWESLRREVGGRLVKVESPLGFCEGASDIAGCNTLFKELKNPYYIGDNVGLTQTTGWLEAWTFRPSVYAVAAETAADIAAGVNFARDNNLRLVVKGGGHSYLGRSNAPDSLLIWTRAMNRVVLHEEFVGAGAVWGHVYNAVTTTGGRYVQGGGCLTVGVAGLVQAGGFGSFSKQFGSAAASLIEAEIVTADGAVRLANACINPELFWGLKGGGGSSLGVVSRLTLKTHNLPAALGSVSATIRATSDDAFRRLLGQFVAFYADNLFNPHWGEIVTLRPGNRLEIRMVFQGLERAQAEAVWQPFFDWVVAAMPADFAFLLAPGVRPVPARHVWDPAFMKAYAPGALLTDDRPGAPAENVFWAGNQAEAGHFIYAYQSLWLPRSLLVPERQAQLTEALFLASRRRSVELHFQKGLAGGSPAAIAASRATATNPKMLDAFALAIIGGEGPPAYPGLRDHEPDFVAARREAAETADGMAALKRIAPAGGAYFAESDFFEADWQDAYWGENYPRLQAVKQRYDPGGLFFVHHGVGSEDWSPDGFTPSAAR